MERASVVGAAAIGAAIFMSANSASAQTSADMTICNQSPDQVSIAIGYHSPGVNDPKDHSLLTGPFVTRGWLKIDTGACHTFQNPFGARYMYWYPLKAHPDGSGVVAPVDAMKNPLAWCIQDYWDSDQPFTFEIQNIKDEHTPYFVNNCSPFGGDPKGYWVIFSLVDTWVVPKANFTGR
jgi:uncharacterized membrane protein